MKSKLMILLSITVLTFSSCGNPEPSTNNLSESTSGEIALNSPINEIEKTEQSLNSNDNEIENTPQAEETQYSSLSEIELDELQKLYINFDSSLSYSDAVDYVISIGLPYSEEKYNGSRIIQVAFTEGCTAQKYKKESGDYLTINYAYPKDENSSNDELDKYTFSACQYVPHDSYLTLTYTESSNSISRLGTPLELDSSITKEEQLLYYFNKK